MTEEYIEEIDWEENILRVRKRAELKAGKMFPHKISLVIPRTKDGKYILARRSKTQYPFPDVWVCAVGGKVSRGKCYLQTAVEETFEEAGLSNLEFIEVSTLKYNFPEIYQGIFKIFTTKTPVDINSMVPELREIAYFQAFDKKEICELIKEKPEEFAPTFIAAITEFIEGLSNKNL